MLIMTGALQTPKALASMIEEWIESGSETHVQVFVGVFSKSAESVVDEAIEMVAHLQLPKRAASRLKIAIVPQLHAKVVAIYGSSVIAFSGQILTAMVGSSNHTIGAVTDNLELDVIFSPGPDLQSLERKLKTLVEACRMRACSSSSTIAYNKAVADSIHTRLLDDQEYDQDCQVRKEKAERAALAAQYKDDRSYLDHELTQRLMDPDG